MGHDFTLLYIPKENIRRGERLCFHSLLYSHGKSVWGGVPFSSIALRGTPWGDSTLLYILKENFTAVEQYCSTVPYISTHFFLELGGSILFSIPMYGERKGGWRSVLLYIFVVVTLKSLHLFSHLAVIAERRYSDLPNCEPKNPSFMALWALKDKL